MSATSRHSGDYRAEEIALITECARMGLSCAFVGIAGVGKSNISLCLQHDHTELISADLDLPLQVSYLNVDCNDWDGTLEGCWRLLRENFENSWGDIESKWSQGSKSTNDYLIIRRFLKTTCQEPGRRIVIILDDCDRALDEAPPSMTDKLRTLRDDNRDRLSFILFTKRLPHRLGPSRNRFRDSMFFQLFNKRIFTLRPYNERDAMQMLRFLNTKAGTPLSTGVLRMIYHLSGGYAALIRILFESRVSQPQSVSDILAHFLTDTDVQYACKRLITHLHRHERYVLYQLAEEKGLQNQDAPAMSLLKKRGVVLEQGEISSPILTHYLNSNPSPYS